MAAFGMRNLSGEIVSQSPSWSQSSLLPTDKALAVGPVNRGIGGRHGTGRLFRVRASSVGRRCFNIPTSDPIVQPFGEAITFQRLKAQVTIVLELGLSCRVVYKGHDHLD